MSSEDRQRYYNTFNRALPPTTTIDQLDKIKKDAKFKKDLAQKSLIDSIVNPIGQATLLKGLYGSKRGLKGLRSKLNTKISKPVLNAFKRVGRRVLGKKKSKVVEDILEKHANKFTENIDSGKDLQSSIQEATDGLTQDLTGEAGQEATRLFDSARSDIAQQGGDAINTVLNQVDKTIATARSGVEGGIETAQSGVAGATETATAGLEGASAQTESAFTKFLRVGVNSGSKLSNLFGRGSSAVETAGGNAVEMVDADLSNSVDTGAEALSRIQGGINPEGAVNSVVDKLGLNAGRGTLQSTGSELLTRAGAGGGRSLESAGSFVKGFGSFFTRSGGASRFVAPTNASLNGDARNVYSGFRQVSQATASEIRGSLSAFNQTDADLPIVDSVIDPASISRSSIEAFNQDGAEQVGAIRDFMSSVFNKGGAVASRIDPASLGGGSAVRTPLADLVDQVGAVASKVSQPIQQAVQQAVETLPTTSTEVPDLTKNITDTNFYEKDPLMEGNAPTTSTYSSSDLTQNITDTNFYEKDPLLDDVKNVGKEVLDTAEDDLSGLDDINIAEIPSIIASGVGETALEGGGAGVVALGEAVDTIAPEITPLSVLVDLGTIGIGAGLSLWRARAKQPDEEAPKSTTTYSSVAENIGIDE
tara:strand:+ start:71 stop:2011 length:1941 start_codon:yes stop_codon:yes gene_type:complete